MKLNKFIKFVKENKYILAILLVGLILRLYNFRQLYMFGHDQDLQGWFIRDVLENKHLRLIGQETSTPGIFIGPLFYYLLIPFYLLFKMDPVGGLFMTTLVGMLTVWSFYYVVSNIFSKHVGLVASFLYSLSYYAVLNDKEVVPTMPVFLWTLWYLWSINLLIKGDTLKGMLLIGFLAGLIWHLNMALVIILPIVLLALIISKKYDLKSVFIGIGTFLITSVPLLLFEVRHSFSQTKHLVTSLTSDQSDIISGFEKFKRVLYLLSKDFAGIVWGDYFDIKFEYVLWCFLILFAILTIKKKLSKKYSLIFGLWILVYIVFFSTYSKIVSEYYLNGTVIIFIIVLALALSHLLKIKKYEDFAKAFLLLFTIVNIDRLVSMPINKSGYLERNQVIDAIKTDQQMHGYPCVSISYITDLGYDRGYRYFLWNKRIKTKKISDNVPVYTIVFPLNPIFKTDKTFGAIGLINPNYDKYNLDTIKASCEGNDYNTSDPMIGFTN